MARTLPWTISRDTPPKKARATPPPRLKQEKLSLVKEANGSGDDERINGRGRASKIHAIPKSSLRTPSSSPVRGPPPIELMHDGYDRDDIFLMVEDEFQTVAQSYTAHLHRAEYKRLVKQARQAPPKALPEPTSPMSKHTKNRLKAVALEKRQKDSLCRVTGQKSNKVDDEDDKVADLWSGTSLGPLMASGSQQKRSLLGLEGIASTTKAALSVNRNPGSQKEPRNDDDVDMSLTNNKPPVHQRIDLNDTSSRRVEHDVTARRSAAGLTSAPDMGTTHAEGHKRIEARSAPVERPVTKRKYHFDFNDESGRPGGSSIGNGARNSRSTTGPGSNGLLKSKPNSEQERKKARLDEVPLFIA